MLSPFTHHVSRITFHELSMGNQPDYEYKGLMAASWDLLRGDTSTWEDRFFFRDLIGKKGQPVLDVGCGTGRLLLDYLADGVDIEGVDNSPEMLALCREKAERLGLRPTLYLGEMQELDLPRKYKVIIVPSSSFQLVLDPGDAAETMRRFFAHLLPGGTLAMPFMVLWTGEDDQPITAEDWYLLAEKVRPDDGLLVRRWVRSRYDLDNQLEHTEDRYELLRDGEIVASEYHSRSPATRWYSQEQARALYTDAGFTDIRFLKYASFERASQDDNIYMVLGTRP